MSKNKGIIIAIVFLGITILFGSMQIAAGLENVPTDPVNSNYNVTVQNLSYNLDQIAKAMKGLQEEYKRLAEEEKEAMYLSETAKYLGLTYKELNYLIEKEKIDIPYIVIDRKYVFYKSSIQEWLKNLEQESYQLN